MAKMVNSWNEWDPLKRVIVGRLEGSNITAPEPGWVMNNPGGGYPFGSYGPMPQEQCDMANEQMDAFVKILEDRGITVERAEIHPAMIDGRAISTPDWTQINQHGVNNVRDQFMTVGNEIIESAGCRRSRFYEYLNLRPIFERYFKEDPEFLWTAAPKPRLTNESYVKNYYHNFEFVWTEEEKREKLHNWEFQLTEKEPLWDAADGMRFGKDVFWQCSSVTNRSGMDWLQRYFGPKGVRIHPVQVDNLLHPWHMDVHVLPVRPGLVMVNPELTPRTDEFYELMKMNDWEVVMAAKPVHVYPYEKADMLGGAWEAGPTWISMNTLSLGPNTICVEAHETAYMDQLDKMGIEVVPVEYNHVVPFGGALHCTTLDVHREGGLEDYFPKQIPGY